MTEKLSERIKQLPSLVGINKEYACSEASKIASEVKALEADLDNTDKAAAILQQALDYCVEDKRNLMVENQRLLMEIEDWKKAMAAEMGFNE